MKFLIKFYSRVFSILTILKFKLLYASKFKCSLSARVCPSLKVTIRKKGRLIIGKKVSLRDYITINVTGGTLTLEDQVFINDFSSLNCRNSILIKENARLGQGVKVYDSDHDYKKDIVDSYLNSPVQIGSYSWIGSDAIILRGSIVGNNSVVGAGAVVKANVPDNTLYVNKRTDKYISINRS